MWSRRGFWIRQNENKKNTQKNKKSIYSNKCIFLVVVAQTYVVGDVYMNIYG